MKMLLFAAYLCILTFLETAENLKRTLDIHDHKVFTNKINFFYFVNLSVLFLLRFALEIIFLNNYLKNCRGGSAMKQLIKVLNNMSQDFPENICFCVPTRTMICFVAVVWFL